MDFTTAIDYAKYSDLCSWKDPNNLHVEYSISPYDRPITVRVASRGESTIVLHFEYPTDVTSNGIVKAPGVQVHFNRDTRRLSAVYLDLDNLPKALESLAGPAFDDLYGAGKTDRVRVLVTEIIKDAVTQVKIEPRTTVINGPIACPGCQYDLYVGPTSMRCVNVSCVCRGTIFSKTVELRTMD